jgi:LysR family D-serine deaminase transcriptional activator
MIHSNQLNDATILANLSSFRCAAKHLSFTQAAIDMNLTQGAISHRIKKLEQLLGFSLFLRFNRKLQLTNEGEQLLQVVNQSLLELDQVIRSLRADELSIEINLSLPPSFAMSWFSPKLKAFQERYPQISFNVETHSRLIDFSAEGIDLAVYFGFGEYPGLDVYPLQHEEMTPLCHPDYAEQYGLLQQPENIKKCRLLHDSQAWSQAGRYSEWELWSQKTGFEIDLRNSHCFDQSSLCLQTAKHGLGVAMGRRLLAQDELDAGSLIIPFPNTQQMSQGYFLVCHPNRSGHPAIQVTIEWFQSYFTDTATPDFQQNESDIGRV